MSGLAFMRCDECNGFGFFPNGDRCGICNGYGSLPIRAVESASPPRAPGASAHPLKVGVESGPGQPIDIVERLDRTGGHYDDAEAREAAAEIRRLREQVKTERRAGIEAAAQVAANIEVIAIANTPVHASRLILDAIWAREMEKRGLGSVLYTRT